MKDRFANTPLLAGLCKANSDVLYAELLGAENELSVALRVFFEETQVLCSDDDNAAAIAALDAAKKPYHLEPGYDYRPEFFRDDSWGLVKLRQRPVIAIDEMRFSYIDPTVNLFVVPQNWLRVDYKYGMVRLLPSGNGASLPLNAWLLSVYGGGRTVPHMIRFKYKAGIKDINKQYPGLVEFIYRFAAYKLILNRFPMSSESISADGLSQSEGFDLTSYMDQTKGAIPAEIKRWTDALHGVRMVIA